MDAEIHEIREKLDELSEMVKENTRMTKSLYRKANWGTILSAIRWVAIVGITIGAFYTLQPYLQTLARVYSSIPGFGQSNTSGGSSSGGSVIDILKGI